MKNWENTTFKTVVHENEEIVATFNYIGDKEIRSIKKSCSCTDYKWEDPHTLKAWVSTGFVQSHVHPKLYAQGIREYNKNATITIVYADNTTEQLKIDAKVIEEKAN